jgi:hypothetical protein
LPVTDWLKAFLVVIRAMNLSSLLSLLLAIAATGVVLFAMAEASHQPDEPYISLSYPFDKPDPILYRIGTQGVVPAEYKTAANEAVSIWGQALNAQGGDWDFVKTNFGEDIYLRLVYDQNGASRFCKNFLAGKTPEDNVGTRTAVFVGCKDKFLDVNDVKVGVIHRLGHAFGLGPAAAGATSVMCDAYDAIEGTCTRTDVPTQIDLYCMTRMYGTDGFGAPNPHFVPTFCKLP